jgi:non-ribosomal peptide synthetase component E (peptide arylation enzyme)
MADDVMEFESFVSPKDARRYLARGYWSSTETIPALLLRNAAESPNRLAVVRRRWPEPYLRRADELSSRVAAALAERSVVRGDAVGVQLPNRTEAGLQAFLTKQLATFDD